MHACLRPMQPCVMCTPVEGRPTPLSAARYHLLKPEYIHQRIRELQRSFRLRIILCHVDTEDAVEPLAQVGWVGGCVGGR